ncbi:hypothetical protein HHL11_08850 [Ramlibacter sp. G-1-2-2]|uniref:Lipoprotein n=1 Tax=Ramlibacter agri TaxID=2728837 RepID=A0A848GZ47_9BURK|nr:hypothetical protein [Ramlibacter agri]NML43855.1 hypothetical protein [Ramlibacter agri]
MRRAFILAAGALLLAGCAEKEQTASGIKSDQQPFAGTNHAVFMAPSWKPGDRTSWESQLKNRTVQGQNDYVKVP